MAEKSYKANIEATAFNRMVKHMKKALSRPGECAPNKLIECIHLEFHPGKVRCIAVDGFRIHEECLPAQVDSDFHCHIDPPRLSAFRAGFVRVSLENGVAYVEFDNARFATKQADTPLPVVGSEKIMKMIGDDERFEVAARPQYLLDAINALKSEDYIILNVGSPLRPITLRPGSGTNQQMCGVLPVRIRADIKKSKECAKVEQEQKLKAIQRRLNDLLSPIRTAEDSSEAEFWSKAASFKADLDDYLTISEEHLKEDQ